MKPTENKAHLNATIDPNLAMLFKALQPVHRKTFSGLLEESIISLLKEIAPDKLLELEIQKTEERLAELNSSLPTVKFAYSNLRECLKENANGAKEEKEEKAKLEKYRDEKYIDCIEMLKYQAKRPNLFDWKNLQEIFMFKNRLETQEYITGKLKADGYMK